MKKPAVNEASLKQGMAPPCFIYFPFIYFLSQLQTAFFPVSLCYSALPSGLWPPCLLLQYSRTGKNKNKKTRQIDTHVTAPISGGRYVRAAMCSHYPVTVLCWSYSNWDVFSSCKMKTPCLLLVTARSVFCSLGLSYFLGLLKLSPPSVDKHSKAEPGLFLLLVIDKLQETSVWDLPCLVQLVNQQQFYTQVWRAGGRHGGLLVQHWCGHKHQECCPGGSRGTLGSGKGRGLLFSDPASSTSYRLSDWGGGRLEDSTAHPCQWCLTSGLALSSVPLAHTGGQFSLSKSDVLQGAGFEHCSGLRKHQQLPRLCEQRCQMTFRGEPRQEPASGTRLFLLPVSNCSKTHRRQSRCTQDSAFGLWS